MSDSGQQLSREKVVVNSTLQGRAGEHSTVAVNQLTAAQQEGKVPVSSTLQGQEKHN
jgi:hypothetical protein